MANYFVCNTSKVKAVNTGGRLHSAVLTQEVPNGALVFVGGYKEGESEIRTAQLPTTELIAGKVKPMLVMKPEINASESSKADGALGIFRNPANKALPVIPLELHDEFELSQDFFTGRDVKQIKVGDKFKLTNGAHTYAYRKTCQGTQEHIPSHPVCSKNVTSTWCKIFSSKINNHGIFCKYSSSNGNGC